MSKSKSRRISPYADRMGRFIGQLRDHEGVTLEQLSKGLCTLSYLNKVENGDREVGKQLTDVFFQRLGKPVELFERILDHEEFVKWTQRQEIIAHLRSGRTDAVSACADRYRKQANGVLDQQFLEIVDIDCRALSGVSAEELLPLVANALRLTQPDFGAVPFDTLLLSQNEGRLLFAHLQLREELEGHAAVADDYRALVRYFKHKRYESRERVYLYPYVACRVIENDYREGDFASALAVCEDALAELTREKRLFAYDRLLEWKQRLFDAMGNPDREPAWLLEQLRLILKHAPERVELLVPCEEQGHVYCINQVIRDRRNLLGLSQEEISDEACGLRSVSRIENEDRKVQRRNRKHLLQKVNMSGERYDYEIISERYEDYLLRSELDRAIITKRLEKAEELLEQLRQHIPDIPTNKQYLMKKEVDIKSAYPENHPERMSIDNQKKQLETAILLTMTVDIHMADSWQVGVLTVNEILTLTLYAACFKKEKNWEKSLTILSYIKKCLENTEACISYYEDFYTRLGTTISGVLNDVGEYRESEKVSLECMKLSLEQQSSRRLARYPYAIACNMETQMTSVPESMQENYKQDILAWLKKAYVAALISNDISAQRHIKIHCGKKYGVEL